jgi:SapC protein
MQLLIYSSAVRVSSQRHRNLSVKTGEHYEFARHVNSVPLTAIEFARAAAEYPIVFAGTGEAIMPAVILGARESQNLYVNERGGWDGKYIPGFIQRYPFVFSSDAEGKSFTLCIDEQFEGCNEAGRGERLFDADGQRTQYLGSVLSFLQDYQVHFRRTQDFCRRIKELDLMQPMQAQFTLGSGERHSLSGFMTIDRERLAALAGDRLSDLVKAGELELIYLHLFSLRHFRDMVDRLRPETAGQGGAATAADPKAAAGNGAEDGASGKLGNGATEDVTPAA